MNWMKERDLLIAQTVAFVQSVTGKKPDLDRPAVVETTAIETAAVETTVVATTVVETTVVETTVVGPTVVNAEPEPPQAAAPLEVAPPPPDESTLPPKPAARPALPVDFRSEIEARVANFRAHQERFTREREEYCSTTLAKARATLGDDAGPTQQAAE